MKLNYEGRQKLRKDAEERLSLVPEGEKKKLPKEILEQLLFEVDIVKLEHLTKACKVKYLVWSGDFLKKVDLSEVSFDDVLWDCTHAPYIGEARYYIDARKICLAGTNAKIDFRKAAGHSVCSQINIRGCDFTGTNLSDCPPYDLDKLAEKIVVVIEDCEFADTHIKVKGKLSNGNVSLRGNISFTNADLSECEIALEEFSKMKYLNKQLVDFSNTSLRIKLDKPSDDINRHLHCYGETFKGMNFDPYVHDIGTKLGHANLKKYSCRDKHNLNIFWYENFKKYYVFNHYLREGKLNGCFVNGKKILSGEEKQSKRAELLEAYDRYRVQVSNEVLGSIEGDEQTSNPETMGDGSGIKKR